RHWSAIGDRYQSIGEVVQAMRTAGLESSNLIVGVDFTKSNEWTGGKSFSGRCMHDVSSGVRTPYEASNKALEVLRAVAQTLEPFDDDRLIPCYGFGDSRTSDRAVFSFLPNNAPCNGLDEAVARYRSIARAAELSGPTNFAPLINKAIDIVLANGYTYHILVIIADGQV
ncbi:unnamed protein product, partial [Phaeothamnion confervicola]